MYVSIFGHIYDSKPFELVKTDDLYQAKLDTHHEAFECDNLMAPILALLNSKGYATAYSCQGHCSSHSVIYDYDKENDCECDWISGSLINKSYENVGVSTGYIFFKTKHLKPILETKLPKNWYVEYSYINGDSTNPNAECYIDDVKVTDPEYIPDSDKKYFICIRHSYDACLSHIQNCIANNSMNGIEYYEYNAWLISELMDLYKALENIPNYQGELFEFE